MTQLSFWGDDTQIADARVRKVYSVNPGWEIELETMNEIGEKENQNEP